MSPLKQSSRRRKLIGTFAMLAFLGCYFIFALAIADSRPVQEAANWLQPIIYVVLGLIWVLPMMPLISWMQKPD